MKLSSRALFALIPSLVLGCTSKPPPPPSIKSFSADKAQIRKGESVRLTFEVERTKEARLLDQSGNEVLKTSDPQGEVTVSPERTSFYVLQASGEGGRDSAFVQVAVDEGLREVFFLAVPPEIEGGDSVQLIWSAAGAGSVNLSASGRTLPVTSETGTLIDTPARTTRYVLRAGSAVTSPSSEIEVRVHPVIASFEAKPPAAKSGEKLRLAWTTRGGDEVAITEATFGELHRTSVPVDVASGSVEWTVPGAFPSADAGTGGADAGMVPLPLPDGFPFRFTLALKTHNPAVTLTQEISGAVGDAPRAELSAPAAVSKGKPFRLTWQTVNTTRLQLFANGRLIYEPRVPTSTGGITVPGQDQDTTFELVAYSFQGLLTRSVKKVLAVPPPEALTFTLSSSVAASGSPATASWTTKNATAVRIRVKNGPSVFYTSSATKVASGTASVFPALATTFVLEALNAAGDRTIVEKSVSVGTPDAITASPNLIAPNTAVTVNWTVTGATDVLGIHNLQAQSVSGSTNFFDLDASLRAVPVVFSDGNEAVSPIDLKGEFLFPFLGTTVEKFHVSTNGFLALRETGPLPSNVDLTPTSSAPSMLAPYWDDLELGTGRVSYEVDQASFPRRLTVQWSDVRIAGDAQSRLTFQVQLFETGNFLFIYKKLTGNQAQGQSASVGVRGDSAKFAAKFAYNPGNATLVVDQELSWFGTAASTGTYQLNTANDVVYSFFYRTGTGDHVAVALPVRVFAPSSVVVSEAMPVPHASATSGAWIELQNPSSRDVDLSMLELVSSGGTTPFVLPDGTKLAAGAYLVLGQSTDPSANGDASVDLAWGATDLPMQPSGNVTLQVPGTPAVTVSTLQWTTATAGTSVQAPERAIDTAGKPITCTRTKTFGSAGAIGTPKKLNETCFDYALSPIPGAFEDASSGTPLMVGLSSSSGLESITLPVPFKYFGQNYPSVTVTIPGYLAFDGAPTSASGYNNSVPSTSTPNGTLAVFWDYVYRKTTPTSSQAYLARRPGYTVISWQDFYVSSTTYNSSLNFQVKLFDDGAIEYHYGEMINGTAPAGYSEGSSATVWVEKPDGTQALPVTINSAAIAPNSGWRFAPKQ